MGSHYSQLVFYRLCYSKCFISTLGENLSHVEEHRWPPLSYELAMEQYRRDYLDQEEEEEEVEGGEEREGGSRGEGDKGERVDVKKNRTKTVKSVLGRERCKVM